MKLLCDGELTMEEKSYLARLSVDPGFVVLKKLMGDACQKATEDVIKLDPTIEDYDKKLAALHWTARSMNDFSATLIKSVLAYTQSILDAEQTQTGEDATENPLLKRVKVQFPIRQDLIKLQGK